MGGATFKSQHSGDFPKISMCSRGMAFGALQFVWSLGAKKSTELRDVVLPLPFEVGTAPAIFRGSRVDGGTLKY